MQTSPPPFVFAAPDEKNILTCKSLERVPFIVPQRYLTEYVAHQSLSFRELHYRKY